MSRRLKSGFLFSLALSVYLAFLYLVLTKLLGTDLGIEVMTPVILLLSTFVSGAVLEPFLSKSMQNKFFRQELIVVTIGIMIGAYVLAFFIFSILFSLQPFEDMSRIQTMFGLIKVGLVVAPVFFLPALPFGIVAGLLYPKIIGLKPPLSSNDDFMTQV